MIINKTAFLYVVAKLAQKNNGSISKFHASLILFLCDKIHMESKGYTFTNYGYFLNKNKVPLSKELQKCITENFDFFNYYFKVEDNEDLFLIKDFDEDISYTEKYAYSGSMSDSYHSTLKVVLTKYSELDFDCLLHLCISSFQEFSLEEEINISDIINQLDIKEEYKVEMIADHDYYNAIEKTFDNL
jgi:hypothetical protein